MNQKPAMYERQGRAIVTLSTKHRQVYASLNLAKKESRKLQRLSDGMLGRGSMRVIR